MENEIIKDSGTEYEDILLDLHDESGYDLDWEELDEL